MEKHTVLEWAKWIHKETEPPALSRMLTHVDLEGAIPMQTLNINTISKNILDKIQQIRSEEEWNLGHDVIVLTEVENASFLDEHPKNTGQTMQAQCNIEEYKDTFCYMIESLMRELKIFNPDQKNISAMFEQLFYEKTKAKHAEEILYICSHARLRAEAIIALTMSPHIDRLPNFEKMLRKKIRLQPKQTKQ